MLLSKKRNPKPEPFLRWLFIAKFANGHLILQTEEDKCLTRDDGTGSAFTDVLAYENARLSCFSLVNVTNGKDTVSVDLNTGNFIVNDVPICIHNQFFEPEKYPLKLIYFRETRVDQDVLGTVQDDLSVSEENIGKPRHYVNRYFIGWETVVHGKNKQVTLAVG